MHCNSPLDKAGFKIFDASIAPSAAPAPTIVCNSSIKRRTLPFFLISSITALIRSSNCPRYFVPAIIKARSKVINLFLRKMSGTSPLTIACANPSTIAVFPTPASPTNTGLFLRLLHKINIRRSISGLRPITGSIFPSRHMSVKSCQYAFKAGILSLLVEAAPAFLSPALPCRIPP